MNKALSKAAPKLTKRQMGLLRTSAMRQASKLIDILAKNALGELTVPMPQDDGSYKHEPHKLDMAQVRSAEIILKKAVPDLSQTEIELGDDVKRRSPQETMLELAKFLKANPEAAEMLMVHISGRNDTVVVEEGEGDG